MSEPMDKREEIELPELSQNVFDDHTTGYFERALWEREFQLKAALVTNSELRFANRINSDEWRQRVESLEAANREKDAEIERLKGRRFHTQNWYASHYGKLEDWARKILPEPWRHQFFSCVANGTYGHEDVGDAYMCKAGFMVVPSGYIYMDDAKGQLVIDQTRRAEDAEAELAYLRASVGEKPEDAYARGFDKGYEYAHVLPKFARLFY